MASMRSQLLAIFLRMTVKKRFTKSGDVIKERESMDKMSAMSVKAKPGRIEVLGGIAGEWHEAQAGSKETVVLYLHGGGYVLGSPTSHGGMAAMMANLAQARVFVLAYRLAPETPFPGALDDAKSAYKALLEKGEKPEKIVIAGDSAGGGLAVALMVALKEEGVPLPAAGVCLSPWADLSFSGDSMQANAKADSILCRESLAWLGKQYLADLAPNDPRVSPIFADLTGLPPLLIQVGSDEVLLDDAIRLNKIAKKAGVDSKLEVWNGQVHVWQLMSKLIPEARQALQSVGTFIKTNT